MTEQPKPKVKRTRQEYYDHMRATNGWADLGHEGGKANVEKHGKERMVKIGFKGYEAVRSKFATEEEYRDYLSRIGSIKKGHGKHS